MVHNSPETTTGGKALKFYASVRIDVRRIETLKDGTEAVGNRTRAKIVKNKVSPPFKQAEFDILYGQGISREGGLIDMGVDHGFVRKAGAWYTYDGDQLGQGKENARQFLKDEDRAGGDQADLVALALVHVDETVERTKGFTLRLVRRPRPEQEKKLRIRKTSLILASMLRRLSSNIGRLSG